MKRGKSLKKEALESDRNGRKSVKEATLESNEDESSDGVLKVSLKKFFRRKRSLTKKVSGEKRDLESSDGSGNHEEASVEKGYKDEIGKAKRRRSAMKEVAKVYKRDFESEDESDGEPMTNDDEFKLGEKRKMKGKDKAVKKARNSRNLIDSGGEPSSTAKGSNNKEVPEGSRKRPLKGEDALMCHQCQRNDKGRVVWCFACKKKRYCGPCIERWLRSPSFHSKEGPERISSLRTSILSYRVSVFLLGILMLFYVPNLDPFPGYNPIRAEVFVDNTKYEPLTEGEQICPERHVNLLSKIFFTWMTLLMQLGYKRPITEKDVWKLDT